MKATPAGIHMRRLTACLFTLILLFVAGSCGSSDRSPTQPALGAADGAVAGAIDPGRVGGSSGFFPLSIGNQWLYSGQRSMYVEGDSFVAVELFNERRTLVGTEELFGRNYVVEQHDLWSPFFPGDLREEFSYRVFYRQDRAGLYEADVLVKEPPDSLSLRGGTATDRATGDGGWQAPGARLRVAVRPADTEAFDRALARLERKIDLVRAVIGRHGRHWPHRVGPPGGVLPDELTRLKYPLHPGQSWTIRDLPLFTSTVEAQEVLDIPAGRFPGWRIRIDIPGLGPADTVLTWYGRDGFLKARAHLESEEITYEHPYGTGRTMVFEEQLLLEDLELLH